MPVDESSMSETAQKAISKLRQQIDVQKELIKKEEAVIEAKGDTYICKRSLAVLNSSTLRMMKHDKDCSDRIEYLEEKYRKLMQRLEDELEQKKKEAKQQYEGYKQCCAGDIEKHSRIIDDERKVKTPTIIRAEKTIEGLREKVEKILTGWNTDIVVPEEPPTAAKHTVDWDAIARQQLADMTPAERKFFEDSKNRVEEKEEVYMYNGQRVSKFEYDLFKKKDNALPIFGMKKPIKTVQLRTTEKILLSPQDE